MNLRLTMNMGCYHNVNAYFKDLIFLDLGYLNQSDMLVLPHSVQISSDGSIPLYLL